MDNNPDRTAFLLSTRGRRVIIEEVNFVGTDDLKTLFNDTIFDDLNTTTPKHVCLITTENNESVVYITNIMNYPVVDTIKTDFYGVCVSDVITTIRKQMVQKVKDILHDDASSSDDSYVMFNDDDIGNL